MGEVRGLQPQTIIEIELAGRGGQQIQSPNYLGDAGSCVVHYHGQLVGIDAVCPADDKIAAVLGQILPIWPLKPVLYSPDCIGDLQPPGRRLGFLGPLCRRQVPAGTGVEHPAVGGMGGRGRMELGAAAIAGVDQALGLQRGKGFGIGGGPAALGRLLPVPVQAQPAEILFEGLRILRPAPVRVQVLDAQDHLAVLTADRKPGQQRREDIAQVHPPRGAGGEPPHHLIHSLPPKSGHRSPLRRQSRRSTSAPPSPAPGRAAPWG